MKRNHTIIAGLIIAASISGVALAQGGPRGAGGYGCDGSGPMGMGPMGGPGGPMGRHAAMKFDPAQMAQRVDERLDYMKYQLKITATQEPLWNAYAEKMKAEAGKGMQAMQVPPADDKLSAPERMAQRQTLMEGRLAAMKGVHESFDRLYGALTPEQKVTADKLAGRMGKGGMGGMRGGMMPRG